MGHYPQFPEAVPHLRLSYQRVTEHFAGPSEEGARLAWLSGIQIAATSCRINRYYCSIPSHLYGHKNYLKRIYKYITI